MCLAIPSRIVEINNNMGIIDVDGVRREASLLLLENPGVGDYVIVHAGFAIQKIDEAEAQESLKVLREIAAKISSDEDEF
jgi:hydrogenase expression/formation protein HypC